MTEPTKIVSTKTKKKRQKKGKSKKELWSQFDSVFGDKEDLECIYTKKDGDGQTVMAREKCDACGEKISLNDDGFQICSSKTCGIIYKDTIDHSAEWRYYGADDNNSQDPTRCGMPINPLLEESSYGCKVLCPSRSSYEMRKVRRYTEWQSMPYKEKSQYDEFQLITTMAQNHNIPKIIIDSAIRYHKQISEQRTFRGLNRHGIIAASIYVSCSINKHPRTAKEIAEIFCLDNTSASKGCKNAMQIINTIERDNFDEDKTSLTQATPELFIERFCSKLNINNELTNLCKFIAKKVEKMAIVPENTPPSIAVGIIYFVCQKCNLNITKKQIYNVTRVSEVTINKCSQKLITYETQLIPSVIMKKYVNK